VQVEPVVSLRVNGVALTPHQLDVLLAVYRKGSQRKAAEQLGLAVPVVHRYLAQVEAKCGAALLITTPRGTELNDDGKGIAQEYAALIERMRLGESTVIGGTIITEELLLAVLSRLDPEAMYDLVISDDERNIKDFKAGLMDVVLLDDPLAAYDMEEVGFEEAAEDRLLHIDRGEKYVRFRYGAQRLGFRHLDSMQRSYSIEGTSRSVSALVRGNRSFFVNESLALRRGLRLSSSTDPELLKHKILAIYRKEDQEIDWLLRELRKERL
jgi:DNA-binding transcriptional LysR family regulator